VTRLAVLAVVVLGCTACGSSPHKTASGPPPSGYRGFVLRPPAVAPDFRLRDQSGRLVGPGADRGRWLVVAFLYTHCPDVCPLIANNLGAAQRELPALVVLAVSVDPKRDTRAAVRRFLVLHRLGPRFRYLTGTRSQLRPVWTAYHVASTPGPKGTVSHSAFELLVDPKGRERLLYDSTLKAADLVHDLRKLSASAATG
jgi:protein SCO1